MLLVETTRATLVLTLDQRSLLRVSVRVIFITRVHKKSLSLLLSCQGFLPKMSLEMLPWDYMGTDDLESLFMKCDA